MIPDWTQPANTAFVSAPLLILFGAGLLWAPVGGVIAAWLARKSGFPVIQAFGHGALASILLLVPWLILVARYLRWRSADSLAERAYGAIIVLWLLFPIAVFCIFYGYLVLLMLGLSLTYGNDDSGLAILFAMVGSVAVLAEIIMWNRERRWMSDFKDEISIYSTGGAIPLSLRQMTPFAGALLWSIVMPLLFGTAVYVLLR